MLRTKEIKIVLLGDSGVGKSSIVYRFVTKDFKENMDATMGGSFMTKMLISNGHNIKFQIWDTAGQEKYHSLAPIYYKDADVAIIVYDITNGESFTILEKSIKEIKEMGPPNINLFMVGNKIDLDESEKISYDSAASLASEYNATIKLTSAKENRGIEELFQTIADELVQKSFPSQISGNHTLIIGKQVDKKQCKC